MDMALVIVHFIKVQTNILAYRLLNIKRQCFDVSINAITSLSSILDPFHLFTLSIYRYITPIVTCP